MSERTVITFGTFDVFHVGHVRMLNRARQLGDRLVVGVSADELNVRKKGRAPVFTQEASRPSSSSLSLRTSARRARSITSAGSAKGGRRLTSKNFNGPGTARSRSSCSRL